ncbi:sensor histidine kinase [Paenibacillus beijingensis]|uniref:histidine kinase n=1 Tax=Paenibacillus beijingensis TaxID=1126833 RepID=A0A0D5NDN2_9BACL|nr:ATP-binding protein [Paenibacillus beijingensis]AJY73504.1 histidine kinase [Paenibacillus beijingensis]
MSRISLRLSFLLIGVASSILLISIISLFALVHDHFALFAAQTSDGRDSMPGLMHHLEQAVFQSMLWTLVGAVALIILISLYIAKRVSAPLEQMKVAAELMTQGKLDNRIFIAGRNELSDLGKALNHLAEQLQRQEKLRITMTQDIAHELRTPLATLKSHMLALLDNVWEPTPDRLSACYEEIERLIALVADLEQLSGMDSPHFQLNKKTENVSALIRQSADIMTAAFMEKGVHLTFRADESLYMYADRDRFIQIMVNILSNALTFTPAGKSVHIQAKDEEASVLIAVQDTGIGIPSTELPLLFERFYRVDKSRNRKSGGGGIGLAVVKKLVEAHDGAVWIESGDGTTVYVRFPKHSVL